ncbi:MAG: extracellular solute-binding protein [Planctomycetes bacterium]|nr:extracellular solute-binding protein [Planctomycetota bacterium]
MSRLATGASLAAVVMLALAPAVLYRGERQVPAQRIVVVVSPHNQQIRQEFSTGFARWHREHFGEAAEVRWNTPGGTTEIRRMLVAQTESALRSGSPVGGQADILFGGGSYEFDLLTKPVTVDGDPPRSATVLAPCEWITPQMLEEWYGTNDIAGKKIYDPKLHWFGVAFSTFGIVSNIVRCEELGVHPPQRWEDLAQPALRGSVILANPAQSGSVATAFETILQRLGWTRGWQVLRRAAANSNHIIASSSVVPTKVGNGESAAGVAIDFYGRFQVQSLADAAERTGLDSIARLHFVAPAKESVIDPDPIAVLRGAPHPEMAQRFVEYCLSTDGQMLWQAAPGSESDEACDHPRPVRYALRRLPSRRAVYSCCIDCFVDRINPFDEPSIPAPNPNYRDFVSTLFLPMAMSHTPLLQAAWQRIIAHPSYPAGSAVVSAADVSDAQLKRWLEAFDAMPTAPAADGVELKLASLDDIGAVRAGWLKGGFKDRSLWESRDDPRTLLRRRFAAFFERQYRSIIEDVDPSVLQHRDGTEGK